MSVILFASYTDAPTARAAAEAAERRMPGERPITVGVHLERIDPLSLPEAATTTGVIYIYGALLGMIICATLAILGEIFVDLIGLTVVTAGALGAMAGILIGVMTALMQGVRAPKPPLLAAEKRLGAGQAIVVIEARDSLAVDEVDAALAEHGPIEIGRC